MAALFKAVNIFIYCIVYNLKAETATMKQLFALFAYKVLGIILALHASSCEQIFDNYTKIRAVHGGSTVVVNVYFGVITLSDVIERKQTVNLRGYFYLTWIDEQMAILGNKSGTTDTWLVSPEMLWLPDIGISNSATGFDVISKSTSSAHVGYTGGVSWHPEGSYSVDISFKPENFPFDVQDFNLTISSWYVQCADQRFQLLNNDSTLNTFALNAEWDLIERNHNCYEHFTHGKCYSRCTFRYKIVRRPLYFILNDILPLVVLSIIAPFVFVLTNSSGERASFSVTLFLAFSVLLTGTSEELPVTSLAISGFALLVQFLYILAGAQVIIVCILQRFDMTCMVCRSSRVTTTIAKEDSDDKKDEEKKKLDLTLFLFFMTTTVMSFVVFLIASNV